MVASLRNGLMALGSGLEVMGARAASDADGAWYWGCLKEVLLACCRRLASGHCCKYVDVTTLILDDVPRRHSVA
jgi:hypothetical protein